MPEDHERQCLERLEGFRAPIEALMDFIGERQQVFGTDRDAAHAMLREIKSNLGSESKRLSLVSVKSTLTQIEEAFYAPAIHAASAHISIRVDSEPGGAWIGDLYDASDDLKNPIRDLKRRIADR